ncbi:electron transfer flavoprotein subunit beta/FixA family protein [Marichromatium bheemlicum]|uniref:Electron transfer flavoprotein subunit beta n=1 Tax=Marichromatium bheemlicum TaxID=365339 RepID=A0ABX1I7X9_9GAMM|nr:electron transfer flavoprotein subunit beta/FixA family protein [Marichromatium bheemlicum]NKN32500.1 electron transfer flavoprotein subunit beta/FixA family protein [Marichromatium bheemlicum]
MKVLVPVKRVIDYNVRVRVKSDHSDVDLANVKMAINPFCEIAVEAAVRLREDGKASEVVAVSVGPKVVQEQLRTALAMGADRAIWIETPETPETAGLGPLGIAQLLAALVREEQPGLVLLGKQSIDGDNNQTGQMLAGLLDYPQGTFVSGLELGDEEVEVVREIDGGLQTLALRLPAVVTTDLRLNTPRFIRAPDIMKARRKPIAHTAPEQLGVNPAPGPRTLAVHPPEPRAGGRRVESVGELVEHLRQAQVI